VTGDELARLLEEASVTLVDVRSPEEFSGEAGYPCDPRQGHIEGAVNVPLEVPLTAAGVALAIVATNERLNARRPGMVSLEEMRKSEAEVKVAEEIDWEIEPSRAQFLPDSVGRWQPFREANAAMDRLRKRYEVGIVSNIDDKLLGETRRWFKTDFDLVVTAQQVRSYKPDPAHFNECARRIGTKKGWVHIASSYYHDVEPCIKAKIPVIWVNRNKEVLEASQKKPTAEVKTLLDAAKLLKV